MVKGYRTGNLNEALRVAGSRKSVRHARAHLRNEVYATTTRKARNNKKRTVKRLLRKAGHPYLPMTPKALEDLCAVMAAARYRSLPDYLSIWRRDHLMAGHTWTEHLGLLRHDCQRAAARGMGPPKRADAFAAEELPKVHTGPHDPIAKGGPIMPGLFVATGTAWLLRGLEEADLLGEQARVNPSTREATLDLSATKCDTRATGCLRTLACICDKGVDGPCPYCTIGEVIRIRRERGLGPKDPLFPAADGKAASSAAAVRTIRRVTGRDRATEHSCRRAGAQWYARRHLDLYLIQFLGRWGSMTVALYVGEALQGQLARRAARGEPEPEAGGGFAGSWAALKREVLRLARRAARDESKQAIRDKGTPSPADLQLASFAAKHLPGASTGAPGTLDRRVQGRRGERGVGWCHAAAVGDPLLPPEGWITRCGWRFAAAEHTLLEPGEVTCGQCIASLVKARRTQ